MKRITSLNKRFQVALHFSNSKMYSLIIHKVLSVVWCQHLFHWTKTPIFSAIPHLLLTFLPSKIIIYFTVFFPSSASDKSQKLSLLTRPTLKSTLSLYYVFSPHSHVQVDASQSNAWRVWKKTGELSIQRKSESNLENLSYDKNLPERCINYWTSVAFSKILCFCICHCEKEYTDNLYK